MALQIPSPSIPFYVYLYCLIRITSISTNRGKTFRKKEHPLTPKKPVSRQKKHRPTPTLLQKHRKAHSRTDKSERLYQPGTGHRRIGRYIQHQPHIPLLLHQAHRPCLIPRIDYQASHRLCQTDAGTTTRKTYQPHQRPQNFRLKINTLYLPSYLRERVANIMQTRK